MIIVWKRRLGKLCLLLSVALFMGQQSPPPPSGTRATGPGFDVLEQAKRLKSEQKFREATLKALEAGRIFQRQPDWPAWVDCYEEVLRCAFAVDSPPYFREAIGHFTAAAATLRGATAPVPPRAHAMIWGRLAALHHTLGEYEEALDFYEKALPFAEQAADSVFLPKLYTSSANLYWFLGDDYRALEYHEKALTLATARRDTPLIAVVTTNLGNVWRTLEPARAVPLYLQSLALDPDNPETLMLLSKAYEASEKNYTKALEAARSALQLATYDAEKSDALHQLGRVYFATRQYDKALDYYRQAFSFAREGYGPSHPECAKIHVFRGNALLRKKDFAAALSAFNQTMDDLLPLFSPQRADQNPTEEELTTTSLWILEALLGKARVYEAQFRISNATEDLDRSLSCSELALVYLHKIKLRYGDDNAKLALHDFVHTACEAAIRSAFALYARTGAPAHAARAFQISEQTKAVVLAEVLYKKEVKRVAGVPAGLLERERQCHEQIARFEKKLTEPDGAIFKDSLFYAKRQRESLEKQMEENYPAYSQALFGYRHSVSPDDVRRQLPADAALIEYFLGDTALYTFLLTRDTFWIQQQAIPRDFDKTVAGFRKTTGDWRFAADSSTAASRLFLKNGRALYQFLLEKPLALTTLPRLFIVPDGQLNYLPFELLQTREYDGQWIDREVPFLLAERSVSYRFSCRVHPARPMSEGWGGFGLEYDENTLSAIEPEPDDQPLLALRNYGKLPYADDEILAVSGILGGSFWLNESATRKNFLQHAGRYGILHLAMHGFVDERNPLRSRLLFSKSVADEDPFVYASDLYNLQLTAGLAVLSACQSGTGAWKRGEGVMSLARAFAFAGCPSMVMSLWNVSDQSTSDLMVEFYQQLRAGKSKDEALRAAKLRYLQTVTPEYAKPVYWAGFVPVGEMDALPESYFSDGSWGLIRWLTGGLLVLGLLWILYRRFR